MLLVANNFKQIITLYQLKYRKPHKIYSKAYFSAQPTVKPGQLKESLEILVKKVVVNYKLAPVRILVQLNKIYLLYCSKKQKNQSYLLQSNKMQTYNCHEKNFSQIYNYRQQIEVQIMKVITVSLPSTPNHRIIIRTVSRLLRLNLLECSLVTWLMSKTALKTEELRAACKQILVFNNEIDNTVFLLLLLNGFYAKSFLSGHLLPVIDSEIVALVPNFKTFYRQWAPAVPLKELSLGDVNQMFKKWTMPPSRAKKDYNFMVGKILQLSKSYNIGANDHEKYVHQPNQQIGEINQIQELNQLQQMPYSNNVDQLDDLPIDYQQFDLYQRQENSQENRFMLNLRSTSKRRQAGLCNFDLSQSKNILDDNNNEGVDQPIIQSGSSKQKGVSSKNKLKKQSFFDDL